MVGLRGLIAAMLAAGCAAAGAAPDLWLETELAPAAVWVHGEARYTMRLYQAVPLKDFAWEPPAGTRAEWRVLGEDRVSETRVDGKRYRVTERRLALYPYASGEHALAAGGVRAHTLSATLSLQGSAHRLEVWPQPAASGPDWLPARRVRLLDQLDTDSVSAGEVITRTVRIEAEGVLPARLPALMLPGAQAGAVRLEARTEGDALLAVREQDFRYPVGAAPVQTLPAVELSWWDVTGGQLRRVRLPERVLAVNAASPSAPPRSALSGWVAYGAAAALAASLLGAVAYRRRDARALRRACLANDAQGARRALGDWAAARGRPARPWELIGALPPGPAVDALRELERALYGPQPHAWRGGRALWQALSALPRLGLGRRVVTALAEHRRKRHATMA